MIETQLYDQDNVSLTANMLFPKELHEKIDSGISLETLLITGPGGHEPDGTGSPPHGRGAGPGEGMGPDLRERLDSMYDKYPNRGGEIDGYVAEAQMEATKLNLYGEERIGYIMDYVEDRIRAKVQEGHGLRNESMEHMIKGMTARYAKGEGSNLRSEMTSAIKSLVSKYETEAAEKGYMGEKAMAYVASRVEGKLKGRYGSKETKEKAGKSEASKKGGSGKEKNTNENRKDSDEASSGENEAGESQEAGDGGDSSGEGQ